MPDYPHTKPMTLRPWIEEQFPEIRRVLMGIAVARLPAGEAEDVVQETLLVLSDASGFSSHRGTPLQYAIGILKNRIRGYYRRQSREGRLPALADSQELEEMLYFEELSRAIERNLAKLKTPCQRLLGRLYQGSRPAEIREEVGAPTMEALRMRVSRCRRALRRLLARDGFRVGGKDGKGQVRGECSRPGIGAQLPLYEGGLLEAREGEAFEQHLASCPACALELFAMCDVVETFKKNPSLRIQAGKPAPQVKPILPGVTGLPETEGRAALWERMRAHPLWKLLLVGILPLAIYALVNQTIQDSQLQSVRFYAAHRLPAPPPLLVHGQSGTSEEMQRAVAAYRAGRYWGAISRFGRVLRESPGRWEAYYYIGMSDYYISSFTAAATNLRKALKGAGADRQQVEFHLALVLLRAGKTKEARELLFMLRYEEGVFGQAASALMEQLEAMGVGRE